MGKVIGKVLKVVGFAALVIATGGAALGASAIFAGTFAAISLSTVAIVGTIAMSIGQMLDPPTFSDSMDQDQTGTQLQLTGNPTMARPVLFGKAATGGNIVYRANTGTKGESLHIVIALAGHEITSIDAFKFGADTITFSSNNAVGTFNNFMYLYGHLGTDAQAADSVLVAASSEWTTAHKLGGIAYAYVKVLWDQEKFPNGLQDMIFTLSGAKVYDPRLDGTNGGTGSHRYTDQTTWAWSENPILCMATYMLGIKVNGTIIAGMGIVGTRIDWATVISQANICDENVTLAATGTEKRYTCNGWINPERPHRDNINILSSACGGGVAFQGGVWKFYAAAARAAVKSRSGYDIMGGKQYTAKRSRDALPNGVRGRFSNPASDYSPAEYPARNDATYLAADGGQERILDLDFPMTKSHTTCQRLAKIALERARMQKSLTATFSPIALEDTVLDTITFDYAPFNLVGQKMIIADWKLLFHETADGPLLVVEEVLVEESDAIYAWDETTEELTFTGATAAPASNMLNITNENFIDVATLKGLPYGISTDQGDGIQRKSPYGVSDGSARNGDAITYTKAWDASNLPEIRFGTGGVTYDSGGTLTGDQVQSFRAISTSASGFTAELLLQGTATTITTRTDTGATETSTDVWEIHKSQIAEAWDDNYTFQIDVTLKSIFDPFEKIYQPTDTTFGFYTNDGGGYVQRGTLSLTSNGGTSSNTVLNKTKTITVDGLGQIAGYEFKVLIESGPIGSSIDSLDSVSYDTATTAPTTIDATPTTVSPVSYIIKGGLDSV